MILVVGLGFRGSGFRARNYRNISVTQTGNHIWGSRTGMMSWSPKPLDHYGVHGTANLIEESRTWSLLI